MTDGESFSGFTPPPYLSASSMGTFHQCPLKFKFNKIDGIPDQPSDATLLGNFVHETLEFFYALAPEDRTIASVKNLAAKVWNENNWQERVTGYVHEKDLKKFRWTAWWCFENVFSVENPHSIEVGGIEREVNGPIGTATVKGFIDRYEFIDGGVRISDYKTGKTPKTSWLDDKFMQLKIYATLLADTEDVANVTEIQLLYLKDGVSFKHQMTPEDREAVTEYVQSSHDQITEACATGEFPHRVSRLCGWCAYKPICPGWKK